MYLVISATDLSLPTELRSGPVLPPWAKSLVMWQPVQPSFWKDSLPALASAPPGLAAGFLAARFFAGVFLAAAEPEVPGERASTPAARIPTTARWQFIMEDSP